LKESDVKRAAALLSERDKLNNFMKDYLRKCPLTASLEGSDGDYKVDIDRDTATEILVKEKARIAEELRKIGVEYEE
jgi:hypothetical protein